LWDTSENPTWSCGLRCMGRMKDEDDTIPDARPRICPQDADARAPCGAVFRVPSLASFSLHAFSRWQARATSR